MISTNSFSKPNLLQKFAIAVAVFGAITFFINFTATFFINESNDETLLKSIVLINKIELISKYAAAILIIVIPMGWHIIDTKRRNTSNPFPNAKYWYLGEVIVRYLLVAILFSYAFAKLFGLQLSASVLWYATTLGDANGFILAWSFFGYSTLYGYFIAIGQMAGSFALLFRRTTRLGIVILLPILINIFVMDFTFDGIEDARGMITILLYMSLFLLLTDFYSYKAFFWSRAPIPVNDYKLVYPIGGKFKPLLKFVVILLILSYSFGPNYYEKKSQKHTPIDGAWYSRNIQQYNDSSRQFEIDDKKYKLFIEGRNSIIERNGKKTYYVLKTDSSLKGSLELANENDSLNQKLIAGKYFLITKDSLKIMGKLGKDSIIWVFKRRRS